MRDRGVAVSSDWADEGAHMSEHAAWEWDFAGACAPMNTGAGWLRTHYETFTLGIFQWVPKSGARGLRGELKRGPVRQRVKGLTSQPEEAYAKAREIVAGLNAKAEGR